MFRFALGIVGFLADLPQDMRRDAVRHVLRIDRQHPDHSMRPTQVTDDPVATSLAPTRGRPAQLAHAALANPP